MKAEINFTNNEWSSQIDWGDDWAELYIPLAIIIASGVKRMAKEIGEENAICAQIVRAFELVQIPWEMRTREEDEIIKEGIRLFSINFESLWY